jgi:hypothetical protein
VRKLSLGEPRAVQISSGRAHILGLQPPRPPDDFEHVSKDKLLERARSGKVTVLDVRPREEYEAGHIPGAVSIPCSGPSPRIGPYPRVPPSRRRTRRRAR